MLHVFMELNRCSIGFFGVLASLWIFTNSVFRNRVSIKIDKSGGRKCEQVDSARWNVGEATYGSHSSGEHHNFWRVSEIFPSSCSSFSSMFKHVRIVSIRLSEQEQMLIENLIFQLNWTLSDIFPIEANGRDSRRRECLFVLHPWGWLGPDLSVYHCVACECGGFQRLSVTERKELTGEGLVTDNK